MWQAAGCWNRGQECVWDEGGNSQQLNQLGYPRASATPRCVGGEAGKAFSACWGNESFTGRMYLCDEESLTCPRKAGSAVLIKGKGDTLSWKKKILKKNKSLGLKHCCGSAAQEFTASGNTGCSHLQLLVPVVVCWLHWELLWLPWCIIRIIEPRSNFQRAARMGKERRQGNFLSQYFPGSVTSGRVWLVKLDFGVVQDVPQGCYRMIWGRAVWCLQQKGN